MRITFRLKDERDEDLLMWFKNLGEGERSFYIRQAIRRGLNNSVESTTVSVMNNHPESLINPEPVSAGEAESRLSNLLNIF